MTTVSGIFPTRSDAENAIRTLKEQGIDESHINMLVRGESSFPVHGKNAGAAVGAALGLGAITFIPGLGPVIGIGMIASGLAGAALGAMAGKAVEAHTQGVPNEDLFFHESAVREGRVVVIVETSDAVQETQVRNLIERAGGRSVGAHRREWWQGVRSAEQNFVRSRGHDLDAIEGNYRAGFEAALHPASRGRSYDQVAAYVKTCYPGPCTSDEFRLGFERGQEYFRESVRASELE